MSKGLTFHVRVGTEFGDLHIIELPDTHQTIEKIKNDICKAIDTVTQIPSNFALMMNGVRLLPEFRKFASIETVRDTIDRGTAIEVILAPVERDVLAARYNFYKYRSHGSNQPMIIKVPKFPLASSTNTTQSTTNNTDNVETNTSSNTTNTETDVVTPPKSSSTGDARSPIATKATILTSKSSDNARGGSYKLPRSSSNRWRRRDDDCTWVPVNELDEAPIEVVAAAVAATPRPDVQKIFTDVHATTTKPDESDVNATTQQEKKEGDEPSNQNEVAAPLPHLEKGLVAKVKEMSMEDPLSSRGSSEFYQMMKEGAAVMVAKESTKKINAKKQKSKRKSKDGRDQDLLVSENHKEKLRKRVKRKKSRSTQSATDLWPNTPETPRKDSPLTSSATKHASLMIDDTVESQKRERWAKITSPMLTSYDELVKLDQIKEEDENKDATTTTTTTDAVVEVNTNGDLNKGMSKEENRRKKDRAERRKKKHEKKQREEEEKKKAEEEAKKKAEEEAKKKAEEEAKSKRMSRVLGDVKDLYELISESEDELKKRRKEEERLQREEEEQDEAQSLYEFLGSGSDSDSANEILIFSEDGEAVVGMNAEENSAGDVSFRKKRKQESGSGSDGDDGEGLIFEEDAEVEESKNNNNDKSKRKGSAPVVLGNGKIESGSGSEGEVDDDDGGLVFYTEEGENVKVETSSSKKNKKKKGKERSNTAPSVPTATAPTTPMPVVRTSSKILSRGQSKKEIDNYLKQQKEKKKKEKEREKQEKANKKKQLKSSGKVKSKLWF